MLQSQSRGLFQWKVEFGKGRALKQLCLRNVAHILSRWQMMNARSSPSTTTTATMGYKWQWAGRGLNSAAEDEHWQLTWTDRIGCWALMDGRLVACNNWYLCTENWWKLKLRCSERATTNLNVPKFDANDIERPKKNWQILLMCQQENETW